MKVKLKIENDKNPIYIAQCEQYMKDLQGFYDKMMDDGGHGEEEEGPSDPLLRKIHKEQMGQNSEREIIVQPQPPEVPMVYVSANLKPDTILGYHLLPNKEDIRLLLDVSRHPQDTCIIKSNDKIIIELDNILN